MLPWDPLKVPLPTMPATAASSLGPWPPQDPASKWLTAGRSGSLQDPTLAMKTLILSYRFTLLKCQLLNILYITLSCTYTYLCTNFGDSEEKERQEGWELVSFSSLFKAHWWWTPPYQTDCYCCVMVTSLSEGQSQWKWELKERPMKINIFQRGQMQKDNFLLIP